jgi:hypothetical protein
MPTEVEYIGDAQFGQNNWWLVLPLSDLFSYVLGSPERSSKSASGMDTAQRNGEPDMD